MSTSWLLEKLPSLDYDRKFELAAWIESRQDQQRPRHYPVPWGILCLEFLREFRDSFFWQIMWLSAYYTYGISSLAVAWSLLPPLEQWSLSYGQLLPMVMLVFVFLSLYDDLNALPKTTDEVGDGSDGGGRGMVSHGSSGAKRAPKTIGNKGKEITGHEAGEPDNNRDIGIEVASYETRRGQAPHKNDNMEKDTGYHEMRQSKDVMERKDIPKDITSKDQVGSQSELQKGDPIDNVEAARPSLGRPSNPMDGTQYSGARGRAIRRRLEIYPEKYDTQGEWFYVPSVLSDVVKLSITVDIGFRLNKARTIPCLLVVGSVVFLWQQFLALLMGGAFYRLMGGTQPRVWTGVIVIFSVPASVRAASAVRIYCSKGFRAVSAMAVNARGLMSRESMRQERDEPGIFQVDLGPGLDRWNDVAIAVPQTTTTAE